MSKSNWLVRLSLPILVGACLFTFSCKTDECADTDCVNGQCENGTCACADGYVGDDCSTPVNAALAGIYTVDDSCGLTGTAQYDITIQPIHGTIDSVYIIGLSGDQAASVTALVHPKGEYVTIGRQYVSALDMDMEGAMSAYSDARTVFVLRYSMFQGNGGSTLQSCQSTATFHGS